MSNYFNSVELTCHPHDVKVELLMTWFDSNFGQVELTDERWQHIFEFHPGVARYRKYFRQALANPDIIRRSRHDLWAFIFYHRLKKIGKYLAIVVKTNQRNFILTAYLTDKIQHLPI